MGRDEEFTEYVGTRWPRLVRTAVLLGCPRAEAEGVVRAALVSCLTDWTRVRRADDREAYVHGVLVDTLRSATRQRHRLDSEHPERHRAQEPGDPDPVRDRLDALTEDERLAVVLCDYAGLDELQAASASGLPVRRLESALGAARGSLATAVPLGRVS